MSPRLLWQHFTSAALALAVALALPAAQAFTPPDPVTYGVRIEAGDLGQARSWLDSGLDPEMLADRIGTGLMIAAWNGDLPMMRLFLERGAKIGTSNALGEQALMQAAWRGQLAAVDLLIARGAHVDNPPMRWGPLHYAVFAGHRAVALRLLERGADINARSTNGSSVLMMAIYEGHEPLAKELLARGADTSIRNDRGDGALEWAFKFQRLGIARLVADRAQFAAAANRPKQDWGPAARSLASPAAPPFESTPDETAARIAELQRLRAILAERGMPEAVKVMNQRIALLREYALPVPGAAATASPASGPKLSEISELQQMRSLLAQRDQKAGMATLDRRIAALRARQARAGLVTPAAARLEISARRDAPEEQSLRLVIDASAPQP